jgi:hypothetical protein
MWISLVAKKYMTARKRFTYPPGNQSGSSIPFLKLEMVSVFILHPLIGQADPISLSVNCR